MVDKPDRESPHNRAPGQRSSPWPWVILALILTPLVAIIVLAVVALGGLTPARATVENLFGGRLMIKPDQTSVVTQVQKLGRLETSSYTVEKVIEGGQSRRGNQILDLLLGDRLLFIAHGDVYAGVDLTSLGPQDVSVSDDGRSITLRLPPAQILSYRLDNQQSRVYDRQTGLLNHGDPQLETQVRQEAEQQILQAACQGGILGRANENAQAQVSTLLQLAHFSEVHLTTKAASGPTGCEPGL